MRLSLVRHRATCRDGRDRPGHRFTVRPVDVQRDQPVAAAETVALVLDDDSPLPESVGDVEELAQRLRGHISQLGAVVPPGTSALHSAQQLASASVPVGYVASRVHLVQLAEATQALIATVQALGVAPTNPVQRRRWWKPQLNVLRGSVFAVALACLLLTASVPRA
ncbi:DUF6415 family natural product biosynthesis protein [Streptomyces anulatus]|uniref:DUF6415 family natural product biosynthesis protein n=1 Tax=Streptomyces anulatus TaxID=1892 RepID=UPI0022557AC0|nr:DUF6415 family natural product biosynthesis protein [Streptomyces anulatus]MCX4501180.1 DUF6415 family natural product biosynthesis protein [Streptomyces anulatus]